MDQEDTKLRSGRGFAAGKFLCYATEDPAKTPAFMRIYAQLPIAGTEWSSPNARRLQAATKSINELVVMKRLKKMGCRVVPDLLGYQEDKQGPDDFVPGGFITYLVWQKVPGESLEYGAWSIVLARVSVLNSANSTRMFLLLLFIRLQLTFTHRLESLSAATSCRSRLRSQRSSTTP